MSTPISFACDAMLGGLARWLRAAGYEATWRVDIDDWDLVRQARAENRVLLSSDTGIFKIGTVRDGEVRNLFIPHGLKPAEQLALVLKTFQLSVREPRCMACGGELIAVPKEQVKDEAPPKTYAFMNDFFRCAGCGKLFWKGAHWLRISKTLSEAQK